MPAQHAKKRPLVVANARHSPLYDELVSDSENFYLLFRATIGKRLEADRDSTLHRAQSDGVSCEHKSEPKPLSAWKANNYEAVVIEKKKATEECVKSVTAIFAEDVNL